MLNVKLISGLSQDAQLAAGIAHTLPVIYALHMVIQLPATKLEMPSDSHLLVLKLMRNYSTTQLINSNSVDGYYLRTSAALILKFKAICC